VIANPQLRSVSTACPDLPGEPRSAYSQYLLRDATSSLGASFANGRPFTRCASFRRLRCQRSTVNCRPPLRSRRAPEGQKPAPVTPLFATRLPRSARGTHSASRKSFLPPSSVGPCRSYANTRGVGIPASIFRSRFGTPANTLDTKSPRFCALASVGAKSFRLRYLRKVRR
jgi:hypothetical protein